MTSVTNEELSAKLEAVEARTDTRIVRIEGKLDLIAELLGSSKQENRELRETVRADGRATRSNQWVIGFGLAALIMASAALFPAFMGMGLQLRDLIDKEIGARSAPPPTPQQPRGN